MFEDNWDMTCKIKSVHGHFEVYDVNDNFICSADTITEAVAEIENLRKERVS